ncbi:MAG TPA: lectin-like protein, partial [Candidatus Kapabacteria bacterium]|nr:lectin-like protein [Candidatus Kapabacteria bacterium]
RWSSVVGAKEYKITIQRRLLGNFFSFSQFITKDTFFTFRNTDKVQDTIVKMSWYVEVVFENQMNEISEIWNYTLPVWKYNSSNKSFYAAVTGNTWLMALGLSKNAGLYMSTVRNKQENDFIRNNFTGDLRIGLTDRRKEADWKWVSGEPTTFQQWSPNQPDNFQNNEHYINILQNGLWNDITEGQINHVTIYEYPHYIQSEVGNLQPPRLNLPENKSSLLSEEQLFTWDRAKDALGYYFQLALDSTFTEPILTLRLSNNYCSTTTGQFPQNGVYYWRVRSFGQDTLLSPWSELRQCVYFRWRMSKINGHGYEETPSLTWEEAHAYAQRFGAHLATVRSLAENKWIDSTFGVKNKWIGINDREKEGEYVWSSGEKSTFTHWNNGEPNNFGGVEDYGHIGDNPEGKWNDNNPNARFVGIMERVSSISPSPIIVSPPPIIRVAELPLTLRWRKNNASSIYNIQIATDEKFTTIVTDQSQANDTTFIIKSLSSPSGEYYWRVRSRGNSTFGEWSDVRLIVLGNNTKDLVAHWDFNNIETGIIFDKSAKLYNAQILNN